MSNEAMILSLETEVPQNFLLQENFSAAAARIIGLKAPQETLLGRIALGTQIRKRHTTVTDFLEGGIPDVSVSTTGKRNELYKVEAPKLAEAVCLKALGQWGGDRKNITHVISVSCTGMIAPGIEFLLIDALGLGQDVQRLGINFMGCFGAFKGVAIAKALALESPDHRVLMVCTELCSLHFQADLKKDTMVANSIFADGAAAVIIGAKPRAGEKVLFKIKSNASTALRGTSDLMTWEVGDHGFQMRLSATIPSHLKKSILPFAKRITGPDLPFDQCTWAAHPGGKAILNAIEDVCDLQKEQTKASWKVLEEYGNMSSPTFLFVLNEVFKDPASKKQVVGLGFGPGLSVEGLLLEKGS